MASNVAKKSSEGKTIEFLDDETVDVGIDTHRKSFDVTLWSERRGAVVKRWTQPADISLTLKALEAFAGRIRRVVYEAGPCGYTLVRALRQAGYTAEVIAPSRTPRSAGQQAKSDRLDSHQLAMWSAKNLLQPVHVPSEEEEADRQVFRLRDQMVKKRRQAKQQIKSFLLMYGLAQPEGLKHWTKTSIEALRQLSLSPQLRLALDCLLDDLAHAEAQVTKASRGVYALACAKRHSRNVRAMKTVPGVGPITAMAMRTELLAPERFDNGLQVASMVGLAPWSSQSGQTRKEGALIKGGNARLRTMLIEAAWRWVAKDPWAAQRFAGLARTTGLKKKAIGAMARRLAIILWRINVTRELYQPKPCSDPPKPKAKSKSASLGKRTETKTRRLPVSAQSPSPYCHRGSRPAPR